MAFEGPEPIPEEGSDDSEQLCDEKTAEREFRKMLRKFENVRKFSSPVLKLIMIQRLMNDFMAAINGNGNVNSGPHEADNLIVVIFYIVVALQTSETNFLGARFIEEVTYIDNFMHEDQIGLIQEYTNVEHFKVVTEEL